MAVAAVHQSVASQPGGILGDSSRPRYRAETVRSRRGHHPGPAPRSDRTSPPAPYEVLQADNPRAAKIYKFNQVLDKLLLEFVHTKLDPYKKLTDPKANDMLKRQWFEELAGGMGKG